MTHDEHIRLHCVQCHCGVDQRFAFFHRRLRDGHRHDIRTEAASGDLKTAHRTGGVLEEQVHDRLAGQDRIGPLAGTRRLGIVVCQIKNMRQIERVKAINAQQMLVVEGVVDCRLAHGGPFDFRRFRTVSESGQEGQRVRSR